MIIEEKFVGKELSLLAFCDGRHLATMIPSQDHKRLHDHERGPNTGGMGAVVPPFVTEALMHDIQVSIVDMTLKGIIQEKIPYKGVLYFGLMLTENGPKVLEYNCRFGDPEAQVILPLLESDLASIMMACCQGRLQSTSIAWKPQAACCVVMTSKGYPESFQTGDAIYGLEAYDSLIDHFIFHAGTKMDEQKRIVTGGEGIGSDGFRELFGRGNKKGLPSREGH